MEVMECGDVQPPSTSVRLSKEGVTSLERELEAYSYFVLACNKHVQEMHSQGFNKEQCQYLVGTLKEVTESLSVVLKSSHGTLIGSHAPTKLEKLLLNFKLLLVLATKIERFIEGCSQDAWIPAAMTLTNVSNFVSSIGFHLELCRVTLSKKCEGPRSLNLGQVAKISKDIDDIVKAKASMDKEDLLKKISVTLPSLHGGEKDLASFLLQRLLRVVPTPSIPSPESKWNFSRYLTLLKSIFEKVNQGVSIGKGSSATVFKAMWLDMEVAVKVFYGESNPEFKKEVEVLAQLCHPNITSMFCCTQDRQKCSIVMELMDEDLFTLMQHKLKVKHDSPPFKIWEAIDIMHQIAKGGKYLHEQGIVHRDLKSLNILVKSVKTPNVNLEHIEAKVADFNVSKIKNCSTTHSEQTMNVGSNRWMAPELIQLQSVESQVNVEGSTPKAPNYPSKCDIYSFAMVCYEILTGKLPFYSYSEKMAKKMKTRILEGVRPKLPTHCPPKLRDLIEKCWNPEPKNRPTFDDVCRELQFVKYLLMAGTSSTSKSEDTFEKGHIENASNHALKDEDDNLEDVHKIDSRGDIKRMMGKYEDALEDLNRANELEPNEAFTLRSRGDVKRMMGKYEDALEDLNRANELQGNDAFTLRSRGDVKRMMGKYEDALEDLNRAHELEPNEAFTLRSRGDVKRMMGKYEDALEDLNRAHELEPNEAFTLRSRGNVKRKMGKYEDALEDLNRANELQGNDAFTLRSRGEVKRMMDKYEDALEDLNRADELEPNDAFTLWSRGDIKRMMGKYEDALEDLNRANELQGNEAFTLQIRGDVKRMMDKYEDALEDLNRANELQGNDAFTLRNRGDVKRMMDKYEDALEDLNRADELEPNEAFTLWSRGNVKKMMGKYEDALEDLNRADELEPNDAFTLWSRGDIKRMMGKYEDALEDLNRANELQGNDAFTLRIRGDVKRMMDKYEDALEDLNRADELEPNDAFTLWSRGNVKRKMGKYEDALEDLNRANELQGNDAFTLRNRGDVKRMMDKYEDALEDLNRADELQGNDAFTLRSRGDVKRKMGKYEDALEDLNRANELQGNDAFTLRNRGDVKRMMDKYEDALEDLNRADELQGNDAFTLRSRGDVKRKMGKYEDALEDLNRANELQGNDAFTLRNRGDVKRMMDKYWRT